MAARTHRRSSVAGMSGFQKGRSDAALDVAQDSDRQSGSAAGDEQRPAAEYAVDRAAGGAKANRIIVKVGMIGDALVGKTSCLVRYVENTFDEDYIETLGVNFMEKTITLRNNEITFMIWDLGGQKEFSGMLPLVCNEAVALLFMFDLTRRSTLISVKEWFRQARHFNKTAIPFLVGTKYDLFVDLPPKEQEEITEQARRYAQVMKAPLVFISASHSINIQKLFKIVLSKVFDLKTTIPMINKIGEPILEY